MSVDVRLWLSTFHNQRHLAHQISIVLSVALLATGFISFVAVGSSEFGNFKDFDGATRRTMLAWSTGAVGMVSTFLNIAIYNAAMILERFNAQATDEQMAVRRVNVAVISCICLTALSIGLFVFLAHLTNNGFIGPSMVVFLTAFMALVTTFYDAASVLRQGRIELDEANAVPLTVDGFDD